MTNDLSQSFGEISADLCNVLCLPGQNKSEINSLIDELNSKPYKADFFVKKLDAVKLLNSLCQVNPADEFLAAKASHLINSLVTKQNLHFEFDILHRIASWHIACLCKCSDIILHDILHNLQCIVQLKPQSCLKFLEELVGKNGILFKFIKLEKIAPVSQNPLQNTLIAIKFIYCIISVCEENKNTKSGSELTLEVKNNISSILIQLLMKGSAKNQDDYIYCKIVIAALGALSRLYIDDANIDIPLHESMGICRYFVLYGLVNLGLRPEKIMPAQQTIALSPVVQDTKGGKKQKIRKQRNNVIESLKKKIPVSDQSLMKDVEHFENNSAYKPASQSYLEPHSKSTLTSDSDMSDVENNREAKLVALRSRVRQSASNLLLVLVKVRDKKVIIGYWWALLPDSPDDSNWSSADAAKKTLAYCALTDPIASSRASALSVILALLSGSKMFLFQAESSKKEITSFIPFSVSLGYVITCLHRILMNILNTERSYAVVIVTLKCCAALVQATPYHKMREGLITELVKTTRRFLVHRDFTLQVSALIVMGCVLSIDPKVDEVIKAIEKDTVASSEAKPKIAIKPELECDDFEEGYSDDEMFTVVDTSSEYSKGIDDNSQQFRTWILDICFRNVGWIFRGSEVNRCKPAAVPVILESLQVISAVAFHHLSELLQSHIMLLGDVLSEMLEHDHQDVVVHTAKTISIIGDAIKKLENCDQPPSLNHCIYMWEKLITPLSNILQDHESSPAKAVVCDCIANIGERSFKELPNRVQVLCCTLLMGSCSDEEATVRAAAVRALAMIVMYETLREDVGFVSDCGENILRALSEPTLVVRIKAAWALGNLSDALVLSNTKRTEPDLDEIDDDLLIRLLEVSIHCAVDNDKIKMSATRALGNLLRLITNETLARKPQIKALCESAIEKLLACANKCGNMKVRWNACYAMGNAMKNDELFTCLGGAWQDRAFPVLAELVSYCKNVKVRINAAVALRAPSQRAHYGEHYRVVWWGLMIGMMNTTNIDDYPEFRHQDNLIEQLCVTVSHLCCFLTQSDLADIFDSLDSHYDRAKNLFTQTYNRLPPENASCLKILQAAQHVTVNLSSTTTEREAESLRMLQHMFIWDV